MSENLPLKFPTPKDAQGLPEHGPEARRRLAMQILPYQREPEGVITLAEWILHGSEGDA